MSTKIDQAFIQAFIAGNFGLPIAHQNKDFTPTIGAPYAAIINAPNDVSPYSLNDSDETDGVFRVILRYPADTGDIVAKQKADQIFAGFRIGSSVSYQGQRATVLGHKCQPGVPESGWYKLVLTISYRAFIRR